MDLFRLIGSKGKVDKAKLVFPNLSDLDSLYKLSNKRSTNFDRIDTIKFKYPYKVTCADISIDFVMVVIGCENG